MTEMLLERIKYRTNETLGLLSLPGFECFTLELPWKDNAKNISCIPTGNYTWRKRVSPSKGYEVIELLGVPGRSYIQIHPGNYTIQIQGCILPGLGMKDINEDGVFDVTNSEAAFNKIMSLTDDSGVLRVL